MSAIDVDDLVNSWLLSMWLGHSADESTYGAPTVRYDRRIHGPVEDLRVITADAGWDCGCWSSWTREDSFQLTAQIHTSVGVVDFTYGRWYDFPRFIQELHEYRVNSACRYEDGDEA
nr:hypothetical protein OG513_07740 [Streptomyces sp. NBC_00998]